jgi:hypothetical protein
MKPYSTNPKAVASRTARLLNDDLAARQDAARKARYRRQRAKRIATDTRVREQLRTTQYTGRAVNAAKAWLATVARHLSKGRDVGDIAVRENVRVARVLEAIETIKAQELTPPQPSA